jgi:peptidyl-prolyl isomerase E (cyclophilin E)
VKAGFAFHTANGTTHMSSKSNAVVVGQSDASLLQRCVFLGSLPDTTTVAAIRAILVPFGEVKSVDLPVHYETGRIRGYAFGEYNDPDDAAEAIYNLDGSLLLEQTITAEMAQPNQLHKLMSRHHADEAVWKSDEWFQQQLGHDQKEKEKQETIARDAQTLQET